MGTEAVAKAVAKKLKYYVDIKRREDGFDLSGPYLPSQEPAHMRPGPTLAYDGLHDRSLKHYFHDPEVKRQVGKMTLPSRQSSREVEIRNILDSEMSKRSYRLNPGSSSPYVSPSQRIIPRPRPQALISVDEYLKTKTGSKQRKVKPDLVGKPRKVGRRSPPQQVHRNERERIVTMAARLIAATETAALPGNRSSHVKQDSSTYESSLPEVKSRSSYTEDSSDTEISIDIYPRPPSRAGGSRPRWTPPRSASVESESSKGKTRSALKSPQTLSETSETPRYRVQPKNSKVSSNKKNTSTKVGTRPLTTSSALYEKPATHKVKRARPHSALNSRRNGKENGKLVANRPNESEKNTKGNRYETSNYSSDSGDDQESEVVNGSHQDNDQEPLESGLFHERSSQNMKASPKRILTYQVYVVTGNHRGAGTKADIKLTMFGDCGTSGERSLVKSMNHSRKFQKGQVDIFSVDSVYLGDLQNIRIGHSQTAPEYSWFLETVFVSEGQKENRVFEFPCKRWFSSHKDDGQILRDVCLSRLMTESELTDKLDEYASPKEGSTDDESCSSYSSGEYRDQAKGKEEKELSSDDDQQLEKKTRKKRVQRRKKVRNEENDRKKSVSFEEERENEEVEKSNSEDEYKKSDNDSYTEPGDSGKEAGKSTEGSNMEDENTDIKESQTVNSEDKNLEDEKSDGEKSKVEKTEEGTIKSSFEDDFWSNDGEKPRAIYYDLDIADNTEEKSEIKSSTSPGTSFKRPSSSGTSSASESDSKENGDEVRGGKQLESDKEKEESGEQRENENDSNEQVAEDEGTSEDRTKEYMAGFLAGVRASERDKEIDKKEVQQYNDENGLDESMDEEDFIMKKGSSLHSAVATGNAGRVKELIDHNASLKEQTDEKGWIPLHVACANGQLDIVKLIAVSCSNLEEETPTGYTSMHLAAMNGHVSCMMVLFALGAQINCRTIDEYTPLHLAAMSGHVECVKWLLANRAKYDVVDVHGRTPAEIAEEYCHDEVAKLLKSFKKELTEGDSTLAHLMMYEETRKKSTDSITSDVAGTSNKKADSGVGGLESGEESCVSDHESEGEDQTENSAKPADHQGRPTFGRRVSSASGDERVTAKNRTDSITTIEEKQKLYEKQRQKMNKRHSSFLDSIRMDVEDEFDADK